MNRRSFLSMLAAMAATPAAAESLKSSPVSLSASPTTASGPGDYPFWIQDKVTLNPGQIVKERLFPPPCPKSFFIYSVSMRFQDDAKVDDIHRLLAPPQENTGQGPGALWVQVVKGDLLMMQGPAFYLANGLTGKPKMRLESGYVFESGEDFGMAVFSDGPLQIQNPVTVYAGLQGIIRKVQ